jgi:hypothetical protein
MEGSDGGGFGRWWGRISPISRPWDRGGGADGVRSRAIGRGQAFGHDALRPAENGGRVAFAGTGRGSAREWEANDQPGAAQVTSPGPSFARHSPDPPAVEAYLAAGGGGE